MKEQEEYISELYTRSFGQGSPLFVLHGGPGLSHNYLMPGLEKLGEFCKVHIFDQRGSGKSPKNSLDKQDPLSTYIEDIETLRTAFGHEKVTLLAHSWGGFLAATYAEKYPENIDKTIFICSVPLSTEDYAEHFSLKSKKLYQAVEEISLTDDFKAKTPSAVKEFYTLLFENYFYDPKQIELLNLAMDQEAATNSFFTYELFMEKVMQNQFDLYQTLAKLNPETLIIHGQDDLISPKYSEKLHSFIPNSELHIIEKCGHFPHVEQPKVLFDTLESFI